MKQGKQLHMQFALYKSEAKAGKNSTVPSNTGIDTLIL
jgi:hypothetical protein